MLTASVKIKQNFGKYVDNPFKRFTVSINSYHGYFNMFGLAQMNDPKVGTIIQIQMHFHTLLGFY